MLNSLPDVIEHCDLADGSLLFRLPRRPAGAWRWLAVAPIVFGVIVASFPIIGIVFFLKVGDPPQGEMLWFAILGPLGCHGPVCFPLGAYLVFKGLCSLYGHVEIIVQDGRIRVIERCGVLRWTKGRDLNRIRGFRVEYDLSSVRPGSLGETKYLPPALTAEMPRLARLKADFDNGKSATICSGYPREWLLPLAEALARCSPRLGLDWPSGDCQPQVSEESLNPAVIVERPRQPSNSPAQVEKEGDVVSIKIPPAGLLRGTNRFMLIWCLGWNVFIWPFTVLFLPAAFAGKVELENTGNALNPGWAICFLTPFWLVAIGGLIGLANCARRRASFVCSPKELTVDDIGLFSHRRQSWPANAISSVQVESKFKGDSDGGSWSINLVVRTQDGGENKFLEYRPKPELEWLATTIRSVFKLTPNEANRPE